MTTKPGGSVPRGVDEDDVIARMFSLADWTESTAPNNCRSSSHRATDTVESPTFPSKEVLDTASLRRKKAIFLEVFECAPARSLVRTERGSGRRAIALWRYSTGTGGSGSEASVITRRRIKRNRHCLRVSGIK